MGSAIRIILIIIVAWYLIRIINRYIIPVLFGSSSKEKTEPGPGKKEFRKSTRQGDVTITDYGKDSEDVKPGDEDYVDYEEVE
jgi:hypothetical protein